METSEKEETSFSIQVLLVLFTHTQKMLLVMRRGIGPALDVFKEVNHSLYLLFLL
jgi:hypothetical protein